MSSEPSKSSAAKAVRHVTVFDEQAAAGARVYAEALMNVTSRAGNADAAANELDEIVADVFMAHPEFTQLVTSPAIPEGERDRMLTTLFEGRALPQIVTFLRVHNRNGRLGMIGEISKAMRQILDERHNRKAVHVRTAVALDDAQREALLRRLGEMLNATPILQAEVDESLLGGMVVQVGDDVYDSSVRTHLQRMRRTLVDERLKSLRSALAATASET